MNTQRARIADYPPGAIEAWSTFEAFRRVGFKAEDIFTITAWSANSPGKMAMHCTLRMQGREFTVTCGIYDTEEEARSVHDEWLKFADQLIADAFDHDEMQRCFERSMAATESVGLVNAILNKGIVLPRMLS